MIDSGSGAAQLVTTIRDYADRKDLELDATTSFDHVRRKLDALLAAVERAKTRDANQIDGILHAFSALIPAPMIDMLRGRARIEIVDLDVSCDKAVAALTAAVARIGTKAAHIPDALEADADQWLLTAQRVAAFSEQIDAIAKPEGWQGTAAAGYHDASKVQRNASVELAGIADGVSDALRLMAGLNRAIFQECAEILVGARLKIDRASPDRLGGRTAQAVTILRTTLRQINAAAAGGSVEGSSGELADQISSTLHSPAILRPQQWPTGGAMASVVPGDTNRVGGAHGSATAR